MEVRHMTRQAIDFKQFKQRQALDSDFTELITASTLIYDSDAERPRIVYMRLDDVGEDCEGVVQALHTVDFEIIKQNRTSGMRSTARAIGSLPRRTLRTDFCHTAKLAEENPAAHHIVCAYAERAARWYEHYQPELFEKHAGLMTEHIRPEYSIPNSVFTSGVINKNNAIPYHLDAGNFKDVWSCMLAFKHDCGGGYLSVPEYGVGFEIANNSLLMFDGQSLVHGVTPIYLRSRRAYRYTIVYYSLQQIWNCLPITEELARIREIKTRRELRRADLMREQRGTSTKTANES